MFIYVFIYAVWHFHYIFIFFYNLSSKLITSVGITYFFLFLLWTFLKLLQRLYYTIKWAIFQPFETKFSLFSLYLIPEWIHYATKRRSFIFFRKKNERLFIKVLTFYSFFVIIIMLYVYKTCAEIAQLIERCLAKA